VLHRPLRRSNPSLLSNKCLTSSFAGRIANLS
jgi:hypothetical protein